MPKHNVNGININYQIDGDLSGAPIMLSNSLASNLSMWDLQIDHLLSKGFGVIRTTVEVMENRMLRRDRIQ